MPTAEQTILVSACLLGLDTRYNGQTKKNSAVLQWLQSQGLTPIPVCPEQLGGLPTPRPAAEYQDGDGNDLLDGRTRIFNRSGIEVSAALRHGAEQTLQLARLCGCNRALLKERSPSCGVHAIYRNGCIVTGAGAASALLQRQGLQVFSEEDLPAANGPDRREPCPKMS